MGTKCIEIKKDGNRSKSWAVKGTKYCRLHTKEDTKPDTLEGLLSKIHLEETKPWNADNNPWSLDMLRLKEKRPGFVCRWTNAENYPTKRDQGWVIANAKDYGGTTDKIPGEEGTVDTTIRRREMFLIEISEELARKRREF